MDAEQNEEDDETDWETVTVRTCNRINSLFAGVLCTRRITWERKKRTKEELSLKK